MDVSKKKRVLCLRVCWYECLLEGLATDALSEAHQVPRATPHEDGVGLRVEAGCHVEYEFDVVDSRQVDRTARFGACLWGQCEGHAINKCLGNVAVVLIGHDGAPIQGGLLAEARGGIEEEFGGGDGISAIDAGEVGVVGAAGLAVATDGEDELGGGVVEREGNAAADSLLCARVLLRLDH